MSEPTQPVADLAAGKPMSLRVPIRVRYAECDPMNVVHHAVYPIWLEIARVELLRAQGAVYAELEKRDILFMVARLSLRYKKPAFYDEQVEVEVICQPSAGIKIEHTYRVLRKNPQNLQNAVCGEDVLCEAETTIVCAGRDGRAKPIPEGLVP